MGDHGGFATITVQICGGCNQMLSNVPRQSKTGHVCSLLYLFLAEAWMGIRIKGFNLKVL